MSLKQSCFKSVVKSDLKRSWWISALAALFIFMSSTSPLFNYSYNYNAFSSYSRYDNALDFAEMMFGNYVIGMCVSAFVVLYLFSYLNKVNSVSFFHSLPATRGTLLLAHVTSSLILVVSPMLLNTVISLFAVGRGFKASWVLISFLLYVVYSLVAFTLTLFVSMLTGVSIASGIFTVVLALLPLFVFAFVSELCSDYLYGYAGFGEFEDFLLEFVYLPPEALMSPKVLIYVALIALLLALSYFIYKKRHLENYGEVIAFPGLKGLFKALFGLCSGVLSYYYFEAFWGISSILTMLVFGILGTIIAHMLANKSFSLRGVVKPLVVTASLILVLFVSFFFDLFGYEKRMPDIDDIEYADIGGLYYNDYSYVDSDIYGEGRIRVERKDPFVPHFKSLEEIQLFLDLHKYAIDHQTENDDWNDDFFTPSYRLTERRSFDIVYTLKNGKVMKRTYRLPKVELDELTSKIYSTDTYRKWKYPVLDGTEKTYKSVGVYDDRTYYNDEYVRLSAKSDDAGRILYALIKDRENISYDRMQMNDYGTIVTVELNYTVPYVSSEGKVYQVEKSDSYAISKYDVNTWALLEELNLFEDVRMIDVSDVTSVEVYAEQYITGQIAEMPDGLMYPASAAQMERVEVYEYNTKYHDVIKANHKTFTEKEDIAVLYDLYMNYHNDVVKKDKDYVVISLSMRILDENSRVRQLAIPAMDLPENLKYIEEFFIE